MIVTTSNTYFNLTGTQVTSTRFHDVIKIHATYYQSTPKHSFKIKYVYHFATLICMKYIVHGFKNQKIVNINTLKQSCWNETFWPASTYLDYASVACDLTQIP